MPPLSRRDQLKQESGSYVPRLVACFYAVFDPTLGPRVVHQIPEGSIATALSTVKSHQPSPLPEEEVNPTTTKVLFDFSSVIDFVIPKPELCGHLITKATRTSKILGLPTRIVDEEKYHHSKQIYNRNAFFFNLCFVFERDAELSVYEPVVWKAGRILGQIESQHSLLSNPPTGSPNSSTTTGGTTTTFSMANLLEQLYLDLNAYSETTISLLDHNRTDLSLFLLPFYANPPDVKLWDVPIAVAALESMKSFSWDVTLYKVCSYINGVNHVRKIAELAEVDLYLARMCIQHLVYYNAVILVDLFQFTNSYTPLPDIAEIAHVAEDEEDNLDEGNDVRLECENYVFSGEGDQIPMPFSTLLLYYSHLRPGLTVSQWIDDLSLDSQPIDVRRMIQFGVVKGFLRRVWAFPVWLEHPNFVGDSKAAATTGVGGGGGGGTNSKDEGGGGGGGGKSKKSNTNTNTTTTTGLKLDLNNNENEDSSNSRPRRAGSPNKLSTDYNSKRPGFNRATSTQPDILHSPYSDTSTRSAPVKISPPLDNNSNNRSSSRKNDSFVESTQFRSRRKLPNESIDPIDDDDPSLPTTTSDKNIPTPPPIYPTSLTMMLDGTHHTDEICLKYGIGWKTLETVLRHLGNRDNGSSGSSREGDERNGGGGSGKGRRGSEDVAMAGGGGGTRRSSQTATGSNGNQFEKGQYGSKVVLMWV